MNNKEKLPMYLFMEFKWRIATTMLYICYDLQHLGILRFATFTK